MLHICSEHFEQKDDEEKDKDSKDKDSKDKEKDKKEAEKSDDGSHQGVAVLGIALVAMGEEIGAQMALRTCNHLVCKYTLNFKMLLTTFALTVSAHPYCSCKFTHHILHRWRY